MALPPGEYVFQCGECDGEGQEEVGNREHGDYVRVTCEHCHGSGVLEVDEEEAAEMMEWGGATPIRTP